MTKGSGTDGLPREANVVIDGTPLTSAQSMALRVACTGFLSKMGDPDALGKDDMGRRLVAGYRKNIDEVVRLLIDGCR